MTAQLSCNRKFWILLVLLVAVMENKGGECGLVSSDFHGDGNETMRGGMDPVSTKKLPCNHYNGNSCSCAIAGCDTDVDNGNICVPYQDQCNIREFDRNECRRAHTFYSRGGLYCENHIAAGHCERDLTSKSNFAVNLNGHEYTDVNGVRYMSQNTTTFSPAHYRLLLQNSSNYGTSICKEKGRGNVVEVRNHREDDLTNEDIPSLLWGYVEGNRAMKAAGGKSCIEFTNILQEDGNFELQLKIAEMEYLESTRRFDVKVNDIRVFPNIDVFRMAGEECYAIDLNINFSVRQNQTQILFAGFAPLVLQEVGKMRIQICESECSSIPNLTWDFNFIGSALAVTKLKGGPGC